MCYKDFEKKCTKKVKNIWIYQNNCHTFVVY